MQHLSTIPDNAVWAVTAARESYNAGLPQTVTEMQEKTFTEPQTKLVEVNGQMVEQTSDVQVTRSVPVQVPNPDLILSNGLYLDHVLSNAVTSWSKQHQPLAPVPEVEPVVIAGVPQEVPMQAAQQEMLYTPTILAETPPLLDVVESTIQAMGDSLDERSAKLAWFKSGSVQRNHKLITQLRPLIMNAMGLATSAAYDAFVDQLFVNASKRTT